MLACEGGLLPSCDDRKSVAEKNSTPLLGSSSKSFHELRVCIRKSKDRHSGRQTVMGNLMAADKHLARQSAMFDGKPCFAEVPIRRLMQRTSARARQRFVLQW
jgi:hypothetical protein